MPFPVWSRRVNLRAEKYRWRLASRWGSAYGPATSIRRVTHDCRATRAAKLGTIHRDHGVHVFPDTNAESLGEKPQHTYSVRFAARELWGEQASGRDAVYLDLWDDYLDCA